MTKEQFNLITEWQKQTFPTATPLANITHLKDEVNELEMAHLKRKSLDTQHNRVSLALEYADCFILLFGAAFRDGMTYEDICTAINDKMAINVNRKWNAPDANGVQAHVKEEPEHKWVKEMDTQYFPKE
jgi:hypothetical protein